ncbi:FeoA family protein [Desulfosporosinus sp. FKB]|uniref:FeoA family protein n=1 Tax=Desulfosporosinus sp. FKB TaxID=1969835 RepID=UPI000B4A1244|nr:FeoA family protein [Desulfosporosinus sp. FKB]
MERSLGELKPGERACVARINGGGALRRRMMDMGIVPGVELEVVRCAPMGGPLQIRLKGYYLAMRRGECAKIVVSGEQRVAIKHTLASR